jgi:polyhydroxyalkanoate synthase
LALHARRWVFVIDHLADPRIVAESRAVFEEVKTLMQKGVAAARMMTKKVPVGSTPADVVYRCNKLKLLRYRAVTERANTAPILMVPSLINRHYILDLMPGRSLVEYLVGQGHDVYMIDWGRPEAEDRYIPFDEYIDGYMHRCMVKVSQISGAEEGVTLLGYCMGGTLVAIYAALHPELTKNVVALTTPVDFRDSGLLGQWTDKHRFNPDVLVDAMGNVPWPLMQASFHMLLPTLWAQKALFVYDRVLDDSFVDNFLALETWGNDNVSFPGECYRRYIKDLYQDNLLVAGELTIHGKKVDLANIRCPLLNVVAMGDHIVPAETALPLSELVSSSDKDTWQLRGGHIGSIVSRGAQKKFWPNLDNWLLAR